MKVKRALLLGVPLIATCFIPSLRRVYAESAEGRIVRIAELEIYPDQLGAYKAALTEEIATSIRTEPGVLILYAVSLKGQIRLFEIYRNAAAYQVHLESTGSSFVVAQIQSTWR